MPAAGVVEVDLAEVKASVEVQEEGNLVVVVLVASAILVGVLVHFKVVNPAVVQVPATEAVEVDLVEIKASVEVQEVGNLAVVVLVVSAMLVGVLVHPKVVNPAVVQVGSKGAVNVRVPGLVKANVGVQKAQEAVKAL